MLANKLQRLFTKKLLYFEWSPPWHFTTACWLHFCLKLLSRDFCVTNYPDHLLHLAGHFACQSVKQYINMSVCQTVCPPQWLCHLFQPIAPSFAAPAKWKLTLPRYCPRHTSEFAPSISHTCLTFFLTFFWHSLFHIFMHIWKAHHHAGFLTF